MEWAAHRSKTSQPMQVRLLAQIHKTKLSVRQILIFRTTAAMAVMRRKIWPPTRVAPVCTPQHTNSLFLLIQAQLTVQQMELRQYKILPRIPTALPALILCRIRIINFS